MTRPAPKRLLSPLHRASRQIGLHLEARLGALRVAARDAHLLSYLRSYAPCSVGEVARVFGLKGSTLTGKLDRLEADGLLERETDPADRRSFLLQLTDDGVAQASEINRVVRDFERRVLAQLGDRDLAGFDRVMAAIAEETGVTVRTDQEK